MRGSDWPKTSLLTAVCFQTRMYPWISHTLDLWLQFCEKKCGLYMDDYGSLSLQCRDPLEIFPTRSSSGKFS